MKNIVIKRTSDFSSKGELLVRKNGRIVVEAVDPKSLSQIIDYVKNNFYSLEDVTIDEETFSFKYQDYKISFEFYKSYDFLRDNIWKIKRSEKPKKIKFVNKYDLIVEFDELKLRLRDYNAYYEISNILDSINSKKKNVIFYIKGNNLYIDNGIIIELENYKQFISNKKFSYIFEKIRDKNFKIIVGTILTGTIILISSAGGALLTTNPSVDEEPEKPKTEVLTTESMTLNYTEEEFDSKKFYADSEPETLMTTKKVEITNKTIPTQTMVHITETDYDKYAELGVGSLANDEKLLNTKSLYFDIIEKYATKYGVDPYLVLAIATQERGIHSSEIDEGGAVGLMQIQVDVWAGKTLTVYDYEANEEITFSFDIEKLKTVEGSIEAGCVVVQHNENLMGGNKFTATQSYNSGPYAVNDMIRKYCYSSGKSSEEINLENDIGWYDYCTSAYDGDPEYLEHVLRYYIGDIKNLEATNGKVMS